MSLALVTAPPGLPSRRDALRPRVLLCIQAMRPDNLVTWDDDASLLTALDGEAQDLLQLCEVVEDEFETVIPPVDVVALALDGPTMGRLLDLVEARTHA